MPGSLGNDRNHSGADRKRLWRPVASHDVERRAAVEDMHKFVSLHVTFPGTFSGKLTREDGAVAIGCQLRRSTHSIRARRLRRATLTHRQFSQLSGQIDDSRHAPSVFPIGLEKTIIALFRSN